MPTLGNLFEKEFELVGEGPGSPRGRQAENGLTLRFHQLLLPLPSARVITSLFF